MPGSGGRGWIRLVVMLVVGLVAAVAVMVLLRGRDWSTAEDLRNYRELEAVGSAVESWPKTIETMARVNFVRGRVEEATNVGNQYVIWVAKYEHPELRNFQIRYGLTDCTVEDEGDCLPARIAGVQNDENRLTIAGQLSLPKLVEAEVDAGRAAYDKDIVGAVDRLLDKVVPGYAATVKPVDTDGALLDYSVDLPLAAIANLSERAPDFETVLLVDQDGVVVASLGGKKLPVSSVTDMVADDSDIGALLMTSVGVLSSGGRNIPADDKTDSAQPPKLRGNAEPLSVKIAGQPYVIYVRPLKFAGNWRSNCGDLPIDAAAATDKAGATPAPADKKACLIVGLVREGGSYSRSLSLSPDLLTLAAIFLTLAVALVPVMKLRFLGPAGHMSPIEVISVIFGVVAAFALTVLAVVLVWNSLLAHGRSTARLEDLAKTMTSQFDREFRAVTGLRSSTAALFPPPHDGALVAAADAQPICPENPLASKTPSPTARLPLVTSPEWVLLPDLGGKGGWIWPLRESVTLADARGGRYLGAKSITNRCLGSQTRLDIKDRAYFAKALAGATTAGFDAAPVNPPPGFDFAKGSALEAIRSQADGGDKVALAVGFKVTAERAAAQAAARAANPALVDQGPSTGDDHLLSGIMLQTMVLRSFLAPVLPRSVEFVVVDASDPQLPFVAGSGANRIAFDGLGSVFDSARPAAAINRAARVAQGRNDARTKVAKAAGAARLPAAADEADSQSFEAVFDGKPQKFVARGLPGTPWVLVLHQPQRDIDAQLATTASLAAAAWFGLALIGVLVMGLAWLIWNKRSWLWLWPRPGIGPPAARSAWTIYALLVTAMLVIVIPLHGADVFKVWLAVLVPIAASAIAWHRIGGFRTGGANAVLMPIDERGHELLLVALFLSFGALPMLALWSDAKREVRAIAQNEEIVHIETAWQVNRAAIGAALKQIKVPTPPSDAVLKAVAAHGHSDKALQWIGVPGLAVDAKLVKGEVAKGFSSVLHDWADLGRPLSVAGCEGPITAGDLFCLNELGRAGLVESNHRQPLSARGIWWPGAIGSLLALALLVFVLRKSIAALVRSLFGFGTPLEAVNYPTLARTAAKLELPERVVVLNGPLALQLELLGANDALDVGQTDAQRDAASSSYATHRDRLAKGGTVVVIGLEIALRDAALGEAALEMLEDMSQLIDRQRRSVGQADGRIVVQTDLSPLDRILQAYEREQSDSAAAGSPPAISRQQQLRWSRLFEDFTTVVFRPTPKFVWSPLVEARYRKQLVYLADLGHAGQARADGIIQLVREAHYLPEVVLNSLIDPRAVPTAATWKKLFSVTYPISVTQYGRIYARPVWAWAQAVRPATREAAIDYLRGTLIEHYQHLWVASSRAERVILDNLSRERVVNITAALALRSLIRRGLVVLDPEPRLINASFAAFVRQAERPEALAMWRSAQGKSSWDKAALPLAILLPGAIIGLALLALMAGESFTTVFPVILGVGPALLATFGGSRQQG